MTSQIDLIRGAQGRRRSQVEAPPLEDVSRMIHEIDYLLGVIDALNLQLDVVQNILSKTGDNPYDYEHYSAVEDLGG